MEKIKIGKITSAHGIKGEVKVYPYTDIPSRFEEIKKVYIEERATDIQSVRYMKNMVILKLSAISDRNGAEAAQGSSLYAAKEDLWQVPEDTFFVEDLIGLEVCSAGGEKLGMLVRVLPGAYQDIYVVDMGGKEVMIPAVKEFIISVDEEERRMTVQLPEGLTDL